MKLLVLFFLVTISAALCFGQSSSRIAGFENYQNGDYQNAVTHFTAAVAAEPNDKDAWLMLGGAYMRLGNRKEMLKAWKEYAKARKANTSAESFFESPAETLNLARPEIDTTQMGPGNTHEIKIFVEIKPDGSIGENFIDRPFDQIWGRELIMALKNSKFKPAIYKGKPAVSILLVTFKVRN